MSQMVTVPGGTFLMGSADFYPEERPVREVVGTFLIDESPVTTPGSGTSSPTPAA